ncbi:unnamed protein product [marine sediment metagenome]|uniref:Uncharacterized protein n=1 Tax=marine sediment metagenome TaxID=412755 RepID=X0T5A7_9ZZZZ
MSSITKVDFDSPQDIELVAKETISAQDSVNVRFLITEKMENGDYCVCARLDNARVPLQKLLFNDQDALKAIIDGADSHENKTIALVKAAIESGDYNS